MSHESIKDRAGGARKASALKVYGHIPTIKTVKTAVMVKTAIKHCRQVCKSYVRRSNSPKDRGEPGRGASKVVPTVTYKL